MSSFITTPCPNCGPQDIGLDRVVLRVNEETDRATAAIQCPGCGARFSKRIDDGMSVLLVTVGVEVQMWGRPAEVDERPVGLAPLSEAEVVEFRRWLDRDVTVDAFLAGDPRSD